MMKRKLLLVLLVLVIFLTGCDTYAMFDQYPWDKADCWYCEEIDYTIKYSFSSTGQLQPHTEYWIWDGQTYNVTAACQASTIDFLVTESGMGRTLFSGTWKYEGKNIVVSIVTDNIFGGEITELVFVPQ